MTKFRSPAPPRRRARFKLSACRRCGGDAFLDLTDGAEWRCLQCGRIVVDERAGYRGEATPHALYYRKMAQRPVA